MLSLMAEAGFAERSAELYRWTDKIGPAMQAIYAWNEKYESLADLEEVAVEGEAEDALRTMPVAIVEALRPNSDSWFNFACVLGAFWRDGRWQPADSRGIVLQGGNKLSIRLMQKFNERYGHGPGGHKEFDDVKD